MQAVAYSKQLTLEICSDGLWYFIGFNAEYLRYKGACHDIQTDPGSAPDCSIDGKSMAAPHVQLFLEPNQ